MPPTQWPHTLKKIFSPLRKKRRTSPARLCCEALEERVVPADDLFEENDTMGAAADLGTVTSVRTEPGLVLDDEDWFKFTTTGLGVLGDGVQIDYPQGGGDLDIFLYDVNGLEVGRSQASTGTENVRLDGHVAGTYFLQVLGFAGGKNTYTMTVTAKGGGGGGGGDDQFEENDTIGTAADLGTITTPLTESNLQLNDEDWFSFTTTALGVLGDGVRIDFTQAVSDLDLFLYDSNGVEVNRSQGSTDSEAVRLDGHPAGKYFVQVLGFAGNKGPYSMTLTATPSSTPQFPHAFALGGVDGSIQIIDATAGTVLRSGLRPLDGATQYKGLVEVALGDMNGDGTPDLLVSAANPAGVAGLDSAKAGRVFVYDGADALSGIITLSRTFTPFATTDGPAGNTAAYTNGLNIAVGDVNGDGKLDLIAGTRGGTAAGGAREYGRLVVIDGSTADGVNTVIGGIQKPFGVAYEKGVIVAAGNADGTGGDEIAVTRGGPVASANPAVQQIKLKVLQLGLGTLAELPLNADGSTSFAPFAALTGAAKAIKRDGRIAFVDQDGDGKAELVFSALDPLTNANNGQVRVGVFSISTTATAGAATITSTGSDAGTYTTGTAVVDHAIAFVAATGTTERLALLTQSESSGIVYLDPLTGVLQTGGLGLTVASGGLTLDGI